MTDQALTSASARQRPTRWVTGRRARVLLCASGVSFMIMLDSNIVAVSLPSIARDLNATFTDIEWVVSAYVLTFAALLMPSGALADRFGRRRMLTVGLAIFTLASLLCGLAPSALILNGARAVQGVGAAIELSAALAVLGHEFRGAERAKAFGFWGTVVGVAVAVGPLVGGLITSGFGWRWAFLVNLPFGAALIWLAIDAVQESRDPDAQRLDIAGVLAELTNSGPFGPRTHELGQYIGVRVDGALAAMAGERMRLDGAVEISAVCVSPEHRGRGYAAFLVAWLVRRLREEGVTPFLHSFTDNSSAIALYERLGFRTRKTVRLAVLSRAPPGADPSA